MVGTPEYKLAKYSGDFIKPHIRDTYLLKSTDDFIERLKQFPCNNSHGIASFDVSLFSDVSFSETIQLISNRLHSDGKPCAIPFGKNIFHKLMLMATQGLFMYKDKLYEQISVNEFVFQAYIGQFFPKWFRGEIRC